MKRRIFIGVMPDRRTVNKITKLQKRFVDSEEFRLIQPKNLHLTLVPPWYVTDIRKPIDKLKRVSENNFSPITIKYNKFETGPENKKRLIWLSAPENNMLEALKTKVHKLIGKKERRRKFIPHTTIARVKKGKSPEKIEEKISISQKVTGVTLLESKLSPKGAKYEVIKDFPFG